MSPIEISEQKIAHVMPTFMDDVEPYRKMPKTFKNIKGRYLRKFPTMKDIEMTQGVHALKDGKKSFWKPYSKVPSEEEEKIIIGNVLKIQIRKMIFNHSFQYRGKFYRQQDGGPIGLDAV